MATVTYNAPEGDAEVVHYMGTKFFNGQPVEIDEETEAGALLLAKAVNNPFFVTDGVSDKPRAAKPEGAAAKGAAAAKVGKARSVPPAYRGKPAEVEWLTGYDSAIED